MLGRRGRSSKPSASRSQAPQPKAPVSLEVQDIRLESTEIDMEAIKELTEFQGRKVAYIEKPYKEAVYVGLVGAAKTKDAGLRCGYGVMKYRNGR